jgi:hypothetical protein
MRDLRSLLWILPVIGLLSGGISIVKLVDLFAHVGLVGMPAVIASAYTSFVDDAQKYLIEIPFHLMPPAWAKHFAVLWIVFAGSNLRLLVRSGHGEKILTGVGDVGHGTRRGTMGKPLLWIYFALITLSGPAFSIFVFIMWLGNAKGGPSGQGRWGDHLMVGNRLYTRRLSCIYFLILLSQPAVAAGLLTWNAIGR